MIKRFLQKVFTKRTKAHLAIELADASDTSAAKKISAKVHKINKNLISQAVKPAASASKNGVIGVLATVGTLKSAQFAALLESYGRNVKVVTQGCTGLVECVERGELHNENTKALIQQYCAPLLTEGADTIVLGCTHYPFVKAAIREVVGEQVTLIDTGAAVAQQLKRQLTESQLITTETQPAEVTFWTNSEAENAEKIMGALWGKSVTVGRI